MDTRRSTLDRNPTLLSVLKALRKVSTLWRNETSH